MAAIILPQRMRQQPQGVPIIDRGNPLCVGLTDIALPSHPQTLLRGTQAVPNNPASYNRSVARVGYAWQLAASTSNLGVQFGTADALFKSTTDLTCFVYRRSQDTTARASMLWGYNTSNGDRVLSHAPYSDGTLYWDYGNGNAGSGRVSVAFTKSTNPETLVYIAGGGKGREVWRNGVRIVNGATTTAARTASSAAAGIGGMGALTGTDSDEVYLIGWVARAWSDAEVHAWSDNPWGIFRQPARLWLLPPNSNVTAALTGVVGTGGVGTVHVNHTQAVTGLAATGATGLLVPVHVLAQTGVAAAGAAGSVTTSRTRGVTGVAGTAAVGAITPTQGITGVAATGAPGSIAGTSRTRAVAGVVGTGSAGTPGVDHAQLVTGAAAAGTPGSIAGTSRALALSGAAASGQAGSIAAAVAIALSGLSATGQRGSVGVIHSRALTGVGGVGRAGAVSVPGSGAITGVEGVSGVGAVSVHLTLAITGVAAASHVGATAASFPRALAGVAATGHIGSLGALLAKTLTGVVGTTHLGVLTMTQGLRGVSATTAVGSLSATRALALAGVAAVGHVGTLFGFVPLGKNPVFVSTRANNTFISIASVEAAVSQRLLSAVASTPQSFTFIVGPAISVQVTSPTINVKV